MQLRDHDLSLLSRRDLLRIVLPVALLLGTIISGLFHYLDPAPPRRVELASGAEFGMYHWHAQRFREILARDGIVVTERLTDGAAENLALLRDPKSGVDVAFMLGGIAAADDHDRLVMLATLYYEPLWVFYRDPSNLTQLNTLAGKRIAVGVPGSGTLAFVTPILAANGLDGGRAELVPTGGTEAIAALRSGRLDAAFFVGGASTPLIQDALRDPSLKLMSFSRAEAYARRFPHVTRLTLPAGAIDFERNIPERDVAMFGTKAMLVAREGLHPALVSLLVDAAREIHGGQGYFESAGEFPGTVKIDIPVSAHADQHRRFGPSFIRRYLPFWVATVVERAIILIVPLLVVLIPLLNFLPQFLRWRVRSRIYRWYGELALLERDVRTRPGVPPVEQWRRDVDRIEDAAAQIRAPASFASEAYTLREHIGIVRHAVEERARRAATGESHPGATAA